MTTTTKARRRPLTLAELTEDNRIRLRTAVHEAGHAVAATVLGGRISAAVLADGATFGIHGQTVHRSVPEGAWPAILYAGPWAEAGFIAGRRPTQREMYAILADTGHHDSEALCAAACNDEMASASARAVVRLIERCWPSVITLAQTIHRDGEARHEDVCRALHLTDDGGPGSVELAMIRAARAPGSFTVTPAAAV